MIRNILSKHFIPIAIIALYLFTFEFLPLQDYPDWLYQGHLFNQYVFHGNDFGGYFSMYHYIPPNAASTIGIGLVSLIFNPILAGKLYLFVSLCLIYFGCNHYLQLFARMTHLPNTVIAMYFVFNLHFIIGNVSFLFGLGFALSGFCYLYKRVTLGSFIYLIPFIFLSYLSHFLALAIFMILIVVHIQPEERKVYYRNVILSALPTIAVFAHYWMNKTITTFHPDNLDSTPVQMFFAKIAVVSVTSLPFHRYKGVLELPLVMKYLNYGVAAIAIVGLLLSLYFIVKKRSWYPLTVTLIILTIILIVSPYEIAGLFFPAERFMILLFLTIIAFLSSIVLNKRIRKITFIGMTILAFASITYNFLILVRFNMMIDDRQYPSIETINELKNKEGGEPFSRLDCYDAIQKNRAISVFTTGLFTYRGANPTSFNGR